MRADMAKVIVERARVGGGIRYPRGSERGFRRVDVQDAPRREGIKRPWLRTSSPKWLNENLAPLRRYLLSNVGRPWDKVFSEISQHIRLDSAVQLHIWQHVQWEVCFDATRVGREYVNSRGERVRWQQFVVDARTGLLRENPVYRYARSTWTRWSPEPPSPFEKVVEIDKLHRYCQIAGIWYLVTLAPMPPARQRAGWGRGAQQTARRTRWAQALLRRQAAVELEGGPPAAKCVVVNCGGTAGIVCSPGRRARPHERTNDLSRRVHTRRFPI